MKNKHHKVITKNDIIPNLTTETRLWHSRMRTAGHKISSTPVSKSIINRRRIQ